VPNFPFQVWSNDSSLATSWLGLGSASSVISSLLNSGVIPSPELGLFYGSESIAAPMNGQLIFGGYDNARVGGNFTTFPTSQGFETSFPCALQVLIKDISVIDGTGYSKSLLSDAAARIAACINPLEHGIEVTDDIYNSWNILTNHSPELDDSIYTTGSVDFEGLIITLDNGYVTTIPQNELITYERGYNDQGQWDVNSTSYMEAMIKPNVNQNYVVLGGIFLSQNYLRVDYANSQFMLAPANTSTSISGSPKITSTCVSNAAPVPTPSPGKKKLSKGDIAAIVICSLVFLVLVAVLLFCCCRSGGQPQRNPTYQPMGNYPTLNTVNA
jgi:Eukaryotic aspartyl protease